MWPYNQFHAYIDADRGGYDAYLFNNPGVPIVYRHEAILPRPEWNQMGAFSFEQHGVFFDYILVQGLELDPLREGRVGPGHLLRRIVEAGRWRLYRVEPASPSG
jgi:hypothetical protein